MAKRSGKPLPAKAPPMPGRRADAVAAFLLAAAVAASWLAFDPASLDSFDLPKAILASTALGLAAAAALGGRVRRIGFALPRISTAAALLLAGLAATAASSLASPGRSASLAALRLALVFLLALPLGASEAYRRHRSPIVAVLATVAAINSVLVVLSAARLWSPFVVVGYSDRAGLGGLVGNAGYVGIALALAAVTLVPFLFRPGRSRPFAIAAFVLAIVGLAATRSLSAVAVLLAGGGIQGALGGRRRIVAGAAAVLLAAALLYSPLRSRAVGAFRAASRHEWNEAFTARAAPWLAAGEMIRAHPFLGIGIGNFGADYVPARIAAEIRYRRRLVLRSMPTNSFSQAHNDYLDLLAGAGTPAGLLLIGASGVLLAGVIRRGRRDPAAAASAGILGGAAVAAFAWFPLQIVPTALWILLEAGRADRLLREER